MPPLDPAPYSGQYAVGALDLPCAQGINKGANTTVAVLDTGVEIDHPVLGDSLTPGYDFVGDDASPADEPNGRDDDAEVDEMAGHGTHVAGIVHLAAPEAEIMPLRVLDSDGTGNVFVIAEAVQYAVRNGADVINMSLGSSRESELMEDVIEDLTEDDDDGGDAIEGVPPEGVVAVASAGNDDAEVPQYPAADEGVLSVTSVDREERKSEWANYGPAAPDSWVDVAAPGEDVYSAFPTGRYASWDGTSMAAPFVAGQAALVRGLEPDIRSKQHPENRAWRTPSRAPPARWTRRTPPTRANWALAPASAWPAYASCDRTPDAPPRTRTPRPPSRIRYPPPARARGTAPRP